MPSGPVEHEEGVASRRDVFGDFLQMQLHRLGVALGQDEADRLAFLGANRAENVGRGGELVARTEGRVPRFAQRRVILFFCPTRAFRRTRPLLRRGRGPSRARFLPRVQVSFFKSSTAFAACA